MNEGAGMTNTGGSIIPVKEFEGKLWILADAFQFAMQAAYMDGILAEREACINLADSLGWINVEAIRARGQHD